jgi:hypothetical protein
MSSFLNSLSDRLAAMEQEMQTFPAELDSIVTRLDRRKWRSLLIRLNHDFDKLLDELFAPQKSMVWLFPMIITFAPPSIRGVTGEDLSRWRAAHKSEVRVIIGNGKLEVTSASLLAAKWETTVSLIAPVAQQQGYVLLNWDQYQKLLDEIGKLISGDD